MSETADVVLARRAPDEPIRRLNFNERVAPSLWYTPALFVVGSFIASRVTVAIDRSMGATSAPRWLIAGDAGSAMTLSSTVAAAMLTFLGVVFSTTLVAIQLAGGQYSPRVVRVFVRSRLTHFTLGLFLTTFMFSLNALVSIRTGEGEVVPVVTIVFTYLFLLTTLGAFITFLHGMAKVLRVQHLLQLVTATGREAFEAAFPVDTTYAPRPRPAAAEFEVLRTDRRVGVVQGIDRSALVRMATANNVWIEVLVEVGEYIGVGTPVARIHGIRRPDLTGDTIVTTFLLGAERTLLQDAPFAIRQLVDVAVRALSPAVNDPTTAVQCVDRITDLMGLVCTRPDPSGWYCDTVETVRVRLREPSAARMLILSYTEIIRYGADSPQVVRRLRAAFRVLSGIVRDDLQPTLEELERMLTTAVGTSMPPAFNDVSSVGDRHGLG